MALPGAPGVFWVPAGAPRCPALRKARFMKGNCPHSVRPVSPRVLETHGVYQQLRFGRGLCYFFGGADGAPFAEGFDAFCFGGPAFFGFRTSLPFAIFSSFSWWEADGSVRWSNPKILIHAR